MEFEDILMMAAQANGGAAANPYGPELWPQPVFAASTGLTLTRSSISGGEWITNGSGSPAVCAVTTPPTFLPGEIYVYSVTTSADTVDNGCKLLLGDKFASLSGVGVHSGQLIMGAVPGTNFRLSDNDNGDIYKASACSVKKLL